MKPFSPRLRRFNRGGHLRQRARRRGMTLILVSVIFFLFLIPIIALGIDAGIYYLRKNQIQKAADAAALAGAFQLANLRTKTYADTMAGYYAGLPDNGAYVNGTRGCTFSTAFPATDTYVSPPVTRSNWYRVDIYRPEPTIFARIFGLRSMRIGATATALFTTLAPLDIKGLGTYGVAPGPVNLSLFGPDGLYSCYSTRFLNDKVTPNTRYTGEGYNFLVQVPTSYTNTTLEIFDPDCYNAGAIADAGGTDSSGNPLRIDEFRTPTGSTPTPNSDDATTTRYALYWDNNTPANASDDVLISQKSFGFDSATDMKWDSTFAFNRASYPTGNFRLNVLQLTGRVRTVLTCASAQRALVRLPLTRIMAPKSTRTAIFPSTSTPAARFRWLLAQCPSRRRAAS